MFTATLRSNQRGAAALDLGSARKGTARRKHRFPYCCVIAVFTDFCGSGVPVWRKYATDGFPSNAFLKHNNGNLVAEQF
jgi:hypothetical protein